MFNQLCYAQSKKKEEKNGENALKTPIKFYILFGRLRIPFAVWRGHNHLSTLFVRSKYWTQYVIYIEFSQNSPGQCA